MTIDNSQGDAPLRIFGPSVAEPDTPASSESNETLLIITREGKVVVFSGKVEYGQGIRSGFQLAVADELDIPVSAVQVVLGDTRAVPYDRGTTGSASTRTVGLQLRRAAATARATLLHIAAQTWSVPISQLGTNDGQVMRVDQPSQRIGYSELLDRQQLNIPIPLDVETKPPERFHLMGLNAQRSDAAARVTGHAKYAQDVVAPGMLYGKILRPPSYGARLLHLDTTRAEQVPGVLMVVVENDFVGVIGEREDIADYALAAISAHWNEAENLSSDWDLPTLLRDRATEPVVVREEGSLNAGFEEAEHILESVYFTPYVSNAAMEPTTAVASWGKESLTVWCGDRSPFGVRDHLAETFKLSVDMVRVIAPEVGGAFGTKGSYGVAHEAACLSKAVGRPVRVSLTRQEEFIWSTVRPAALIEIRSGFKSDGRIVAWEYAAYHAGETAFRGQRGADTPYNTPNVRIATANSEAPLRSGSYRSLGGAINHFAREVHIDEIASIINMDPVKLRFLNLTHPRLRGVLAEAVSQFGWEHRREGIHVGSGVAIGYDAGSYVAECVELVVEASDVHVRRVTAAFDCGLVLNPDAVQNQVEGSIMMGIGTALWEAMEFHGGKPLNPSFARYRVPRITDLPEIDVVLVGDPVNASTGAGEPGIVPVAAAVANAVYDATGKRISQLPITRHLL
ncbi:molybdopterin-dependent oxidoreductase [Dehalococcoidia bacterium]|nr:molybdopterin-dependent oxidoreductase [Dehalococcoidia bacterium]